MSKNVFDCKKFKNRILDLMEDQKITPKQIVADTENKISDAWFSKLKRGAVKSPSADIVFILSQYFNVSTDYLLGLTDYKTTGKATKELCATLGLSDYTVECLMNDNNIEIRKLLDLLIEDNRGDPHSLLKKLYCFFEFVHAKKDYIFSVWSDGDIEAREIDERGEVVKKHESKSSIGGYAFDQSIRANDYIANESIRGIERWLYVYYMTHSLFIPREENIVYNFMEVTNDPTSET